jgi:hypothetical protein
MAENSRYIVLSRNVVRNIVTDIDELEITLFDLDAESEDDAVLVITAKEFIEHRRIAQAHEIDFARNTLESDYHAEWISS